MNENLLVVPVKDNVIASDMYFGDQRTATGLIIPTDDGKSFGIKPRWAKVYSVGPTQKDLVPGDYILVEHGRWTRGVDFDLEDGSKITLRKIDLEAILLISDEKPNDAYVAEDKLLDLKTN
jgi:co-chaperonin GroES (HSP10)